MEAPTTGHGQGHSEKMVFGYVRELRWRCQLACAHARRVITLGTTVCPLPVLNRLGRSFCVLLAIITCVPADAAKAAVDCHMFVTGHRLL